MSLPEELINLRVSLEERLFVGHLCEDATNGPDVDRTGVLGGAQQDLRGPIPQGHDLVGVDADGNSEGARKAKVGDLDGSILVDQEILGLEVAVEDAALVAEEHALGGKHRNC